MTYQDPVIQAYIDLLQTKAGAIKMFYQGEPVRVPASNFPIAMISKRQTRVGAHTNAEDEHGIGLSITVITDVRQDLNTEESSAAVTAGVASLYDIIEGRQEDLTLKETSILGILRGNILVDPARGLRTDLGSLTVVDYGLTLRDRAVEAWSIEGRVDIVAHFTQVR